MSQVILRNELRLLPVKLTEGELMQRSRHAAELIGQAESEQEELNEHKKERKQAIDALEVEGRRLLHGVRRGEEEREVEVHVVADYAEREIHLVRQDTGEVYFQRAMTPGESQIELLPRSRASSE
jgi:hypothetical protein